MKDGSVRLSRVLDTKQASVAASLRGAIVEGRYLPGDCLPPQTELMKRLGVSGATVQAAMAILARDGFVVGKTRCGTRVTEFPPHRHRYGWVFPLAADDRQWQFSHFYLAVRQAVNLIHRPPACQIETFLDVASHTESESYHRLAADLAAERLAGVVFHDPYHFRLTPLAGLLDNCAVPMVGIMKGHWSPAVSGLLGVTLGGAPYERAVAWFRDRGRRRVAALCISGFADEFVQQFERTVAEHGLETRPYWIHGGYPANRWWVRRVIHLLMTGPANERPDALLIADDNLVEEATLGLLLAGVRVPQDIEVVAHANFPYPTRSLCPATRIGYDARQVVQTCIDLIDRRRRGEPVPEMTELPASFEHEVEPLREMPKQ